MEVDVILALGILSGAVVALMFAKITRWYELVLLGGWGVLLGAALAGAQEFSRLSIESLWNAIF